MATTYRCTVIVHRLELFRHLPAKALAEPTGFTGDPKASFRAMLGEKETYRDPLSRLFGLPMELGVWQFRRETTIGRPDLVGCFFLNLDSFSSTIFLHPFPTLIEIATIIYLFGMVCWRHL